MRFIKKGIITLLSMSLVLSMTTLYSPTISSAKTQYGYNQNQNKSAKSISIKNADEDDGRHIIDVGDTFNFNTKLTPRNSKDKTYWYISNKDCASVNSKGVVKGKEQGIVVLTAVAATNKKGAAYSNVKDSIYIEIVDEDNDDEISNFDDFEDLMGDYYFKYMEDIISSHQDYDLDDFDDFIDYMEDNYEDEFDDLDYYVDCGYFDYLYDHFYADYYDDDNNTPVVNANVVDVKSLDASTLTIAFDQVINSSTVIGSWNSLLNITIIGQYDSSGKEAKFHGNLTAFLSSDGKTLTVKAEKGFCGLYTIKCTSSVKTVNGGSLNSVNRNIVINYPTTVGAQAKLVSLERSSTYKITATFDSAIKTPGYLMIGNNEWIQGEVDRINSNIVSYNLSFAFTTLTGYQKVSIGYWNGVNAPVNDTSTNKFTDMNINFTIGNNNDIKTLPHPNSIKQQTDNPSIINMQFSNKLDVATASNAANYNIPGVTIASAEVTNTDNSGIVKLTLKQGTVAVSGSYIITISGVKGLNNTYSEINKYSTMLLLVENTPPVLTTYNYTYPNTITLVFNEKMFGTPSFRYKINNQDIGAVALIDGNKIVVTLSTVPNVNDIVQIIPNSDCQIFDYLCNKMTSLQIPYIAITK